MHRLATISAVSGALLGLTLVAGCERTEYEEPAVDETVPTTPTYDDEDVTTPPADVEEPDDQRAAAPPIEGQAETTFVGVLQQSQGGEGEAGAWVLTGTEEGDIEVDVTNVTDDVNNLQGMRVLVTGELIERTDVQGAPMQVLVAERIVAT